MRFLLKICVYFKHFLYLCKVIKIICIVAFTDSITSEIRVLDSTTSNATCSDREVVCLIPIFCTPCRQAI